MILRLNKNKEKTSCFLIYKLYGKMHIFVWKKCTNSRNYNHVKKYKMGEKVICYTDLKKILLILETYVNTISLVTKDMHFLALKIILKNKNELYVYSDR